MSIPFTYINQNNTYYFRMVLPNRVSGGRIELRFSLCTKVASEARVRAYRAWLYAKSLDSSNNILQSRSLIRSIAMSDGNETGTSEISPRLGPEVVPLCDVIDSWNSSLIQNAIAQVAGDGGRILVRFPGDDKCAHFRIHDPQYEPAPRTPLDVGYVAPQNVVLTSQAIDGAKFSTTDHFEVEGFYSYEPPHWDFKSGFKSRFEPSPALKYRLSEVLITKTRASTFWVPSQHQPIANTSTPIKCGLISEELNRFAAVKQDRNKWTKRTMDDYQSVFETFVEIIGDKPVNQINQQDIECYLSMLNYLPPNRKKDPTYSNLSAQKACSLNKEKRGVTLSDKSKNKYIERFVGPFQKFVDAKYIPYNFFTHVERYKITRADRLAAREPFTDDELKIIFESDQSIELLNAKACMPSRVWGLLIALFSGARAEEIFALTLQDVKIDDETMYFDIVDRDDHSHVKTAAGIRAVPVHRKLLELGFKDYLNKARKVQPKLDCPMLFPDLTRSPSHGWSRNTTRWYNEQFLRQLGIKQDTRKVFHSFRHTLADKFKRNWKANQLMVSSYLGHDDDYSGRPEWKKGYGSKFSPTELREIADLIEFDINFDMLKKNCLDKLKVRKII